MLLKIHRETPSLRQIRRVADVLRSGGIIIYPTDTVYALGCDINNHKAVQKVAKLKGVQPERANFSLICYDLSDLSDYAKQLDNSVFKLMKKNLPGPFTFILPASNQVPRLFKNNKKTVGIRIPDNNITREIVRELGNPIISTSIYDEDEILEYTSDPELIYDKYKDIVDIVIDGGYGNNEPSTVVDCTNGQPMIIREGITSELFS